MLDPVSQFVAKTAASFALRESGRLLQQKLGASNQALLQARDEILWEWVLELKELMRRHIDTQDAPYREQVQQRFGEYEMSALFANYCDDAYREPEEDRRIFLQHAAAGLANLEITLSEHSRIFRVLRELDGNDVRVLYALWRLPLKVPPGGKSPGRLNFELWQRSGADPLEPSGCIRVGVEGGGAGTGASHEYLAITRTGVLVLRATRSYLSTRGPAYPVPGHESREDFRTEMEAETQCRAVTGLVDTILQASRPQFGGHVSYDSPNISAGAPSRGKAQLVVRNIPSALASSLNFGRVSNSAQIGDPVDEVWYAPPITDQTGQATLHVYGPHDVLRWLAYETDARW